MRNLAVRTLFTFCLLCVAGIELTGFSLSALAGDMSPDARLRGSNAQDSEDFAGESLPSIRRRTRLSTSVTKNTVETAKKSNSNTGIVLTSDNSNATSLAPLALTDSHPSDFSQPPSPSNSATPVFGLAIDDPCGNRPCINSCEQQSHSGFLPEFFSQFYSNKSEFLSCTDDFAWYAGGLGRGYYLEDQRYNFTGNEQTFAVQGVVDAAVRRVEGDWILTFDSQFFLNEPYDRHMLTNTPVLNAFAPNFQIDPFQISLLNLSARKNDFLVQVGQFVTPFGRFYYPLYNNSFWDSPFIREAAILYRETGALVQWDPKPFIATLAFTNGGLGQDTNSSKALIARIGLYGDSFALGSSLKVQDGIGSEGNKQCNSHIGFDAMYRWGQWTLSSEAIIDYYGMNRPGLNPNDITWGRSVYFRDANQNVGHPLTGYGYYVNLEHSSERWLVNLNYGDYLPQKIGDPRQDTPIHRGLIKTTRHVTRNLDIFCINLLENSVPILPKHVRDGFGLMVGFQYSL